MYIPEVCLGYFTILLIWTEISAKQCFKRCSNQNMIYLSIELRAKEIVLRCNEKISGYITEYDIPSFDAKYLTVIDDNSPLNLNTMAHKCHKTREKIIKYALNPKYLSIIVTKSILRENHFIKYLKLERNLTASEEVANFTRFRPDFLVHGSFLKTFIINNLRLYNLKDYFQNLSHVETIDLASNHIETLDETAFKDLIKLKYLSLRDNKIRSLSPNVFTRSVDMNFLDLSHNNITHLPRKIFANTINMRFLNLSKNNLEDIDVSAFKALSKMEYLDLSGNRKLSLKVDIFSNAPSLKSLNLSECHLTQIPINFLYRSQNLIALNVSRNAIDNLENDSFKNLTELRILDLSYNNLKILPETLLQSLSKLRNIFLSSNKLTVFNSKVFSGINTLETIDMSSNLVNTFSSPLERFKASHIDLRNNTIEKFPAFLLRPVVGLKIMDLSQNHIKSIKMMEELIPEECNMEIYLRQNKIEEVDIPNLESRKNFNNKNKWKLMFGMSQNKVRCNCLRYRLEQESRPDEETVVEMTSKSNVCYQRVYQYNCPIIHIENCPNECDCYYTRFENVIHVNCSHRGLTKYPDVRNLKTDWYEHNQTFVELHDNKLNLDGQDKLKDYTNVTRLDLSNNKIQEIKWLPTNLSTLMLDNNKLTFISQETLENLRNNSNLQKLSLVKNPWDCDCKAIHMQKFLIQFNNIKMNQSDVICRETLEPLIYAKLCETLNTLRLALPLSLTAVLTISSALAALYYKYNTSIKVYLYSKNMCLWCVAEEEIDKEKIYDIFISFSHKDQDFVENELLRNLESGEDPFRICIHFRDFIPGEFISTQIVRSVLDSRRTLVVLSNNFMESVWGKMEFRTAHMQAINEGRARVVVVIYGELDENVLDDEMKTYLNTNTYVKWGDPWFWNKLNYALPHSKIRTQRPTRASQEFLPLN